MAAEIKLTIIGTTSAVKEFLNGAATDPDDALAVRIPTSDVFLSYPAVGTKHGCYEVTLPRGCRAFVSIFDANRKLTDLNFSIIIDGGQS